MNTLKKVLTTASVVALAASPLLAAAQVTEVTGSSITSIDDFTALLQGVLRLVFVIFGILAVLAILYAAILYLTAGGNEENRKKAGGYLKFGIIAIIVAVLAFTIIPLVQSFIEYR